MSVQSHYTPRALTPRPPALVLYEPQSLAANCVGAPGRLQALDNRWDQVSDIRLRTIPQRLSAADIAVAVVDTHDAVPAAVQVWCQQADPPLAFVGGFSTPEAFLRRRANAVAPDVVVFDLGPDGQHPRFDWLAQVADGDHRVIVNSHLSSTETILRCLELGAVTYLVKSEGRQHLIEAIRAASGDEPYIGPRMAEALFDDRRMGRPNLAPREKEVLVAWLQTENKDLVARRLFIQPTTVRTHLQRIRAKYAAVGRPARTKSALAARAIQDGLIGVGDL